MPDGMENPWLKEGPWKFLLNAPFPDLDSPQKAVKHLPSDLQGCAVLPPPPPPQAGAQGAVPSGRGGGKAVVAADDCSALTPRTTLDVL